jgi:hypothetical protein
MLRNVLTILITLGVVGCGDSSNPPKADGPVAAQPDTAVVPKEASAPSEASVPKDTSGAVLIGEWTGSHPCACVLPYQIDLLLESGGKATANIDEGSMLADCHQYRKFTAGNYTVSGNQLTVKFTAATDSRSGCQYSSMDRTDYVYTASDLSDWDTFFSGTFTLTDKTLAIDKGGSVMTLTRKY